jgi:hypothetical protein
MVRTFNINSKTRARPSIRDGLVLSLRTLGDLLDSLHACVVFNAGVFVSGTCGRANSARHNCHLAISRIADWHPAFAAAKANLVGVSPLRHTTRTASITPG